ncbi:MAG: FAD-dependent oxidoreductase, partial [Desulfomonilaceae bacterium]
FFGAGLQQISALSFIPEIGFQFDTQVSKRKLNDSEQTEETPDKEKGSGAYTFTNGLSELPEAIFRKLGHKRVRLECNVSSIKPTDKLYQVHYVDKSGLERIVETEAVIIATPAPTALKIAAEALTEAQKKILGNIQYSSYTTVALFCSSPIFDKSFDLGVGNKFVFTDLYDGSWVQRAFDRDSSKTNERVLCAHVPDYHPDNLLDGSSDVELVGKVIADLGNIFPHAEANIVGHDVKTTTLAYPVMQPGAYQNIAKLNDLNQGRVLLAGQYMIYPTIEAAIESGYLAAIKLDADLGGQNSAAEQPAQE